MRENLSFTGLSSDRICRLAQELEKRKRTVKEKVSQFLTPGSNACSRSLLFEFFIFVGTKNLPLGEQYYIFSSISQFLNLMNAHKKLLERTQRGITATQNLTHGGTEIAAVEKKIFKNFETCGNTNKHKLKIFYHLTELLEKRG